MKLTGEEKAIQAGELGEPARWAIEHQIKVGEMFDAVDMVAVGQAHIMADPESLGIAGVSFLEKLAAQGAQVTIPTITDPRGVDLEHYRALGQSEEMAQLERRTIAAFSQMGILMTNTCINYQTILPPLFGQHVAFGDTGVVIYSNSVCGARSNFEGGPSAVAAGLTGRTPRYGLHLPQNRRATKKYRLRVQPRELTDWGVIGAVIGKSAGSYWEVPLVEGLAEAPTSDEIKHFGAAMASYGSIALFHLSGVTPEVLRRPDGGSELPSAQDVTQSDLDTLRSNFGRRGDSVDVVVFAAPQLSLLEMRKVAELSSGKTFKIPLIVCTSPQVYADASRMKLVETIENSGGRVLSGTCFYNQYAREIGEANNWVNILSNSAKIVNILGGYGYQPALANMETCVDSACAGKLV